MSGVVELSALAWTGFALATLVGVVLAYPLVRRRVLALGPETRGRVLAWVAASPVVLPTLLTFGCFVPSVALQLLGGSDHCAPHHDAHAHFCLVHATAPVGALGSSVTVGAVLVVATLTTLECLRLAGGWRRARSLASEAAAGMAAFTIGLVRPHAVVGAALRDALAPGLLEAVVAHEQAHVARRDNLTKALAAITACLLPPSTRGRVLRDLDQACEEACDRRAAAAVGDALVVAEAILAAERLALGWPSPVTVSAFGDAVIEGRVEALLRCDAGADDERSLGTVLVVVVGSTLALAVPLHDLVEDLVALLGH